MSLAISTILVNPMASSYSVIILAAEQYPPQQHQSEFESSQHLQINASSALQTDAPPLLHLSCGCWLTLPGHGSDSDRQRPTRSKTRPAPTRTNITTHVMGHPTLADTQEACHTAVGRCQSHTLSSILCQIFLPSQYRAYCSGTDNMITEARHSEWKRVPVENWGQAETRWCVVETRLGLDQ